LRLALLAQKRFEIAIAVHHSIDQHIVAFRPVQNEVLTHRECADAGRKIVAWATSARIRSEQKESGGHGVHQAISGLDTAVSRNLQPDVVEVGFSLCCEAMRH